MCECGNCLLCREGGGRVFNSPEPPVGRQGEQHDLGKACARPGNHVDWPTAIAWAALIALGAASAAGFIGWSWFVAHRGGLV